MDIYFRSGIPRWANTRQAVEQHFIITQDNEFDDEVVVNWGGICYGKNIINSNAAVETCSDKIETLRAIGELAPPWSEEPIFEPPFVASMRVGSRGVGKRRFRRGIKNPSDWDYFMPFFSSFREYRIITLKTSRRYIIACYEKVRYEGGRIFRPNWDWTWVKRRDMRQDIKDAALEATRRINVDLAGVDVIELPIIEARRYPRDYFVLEVNSAPGLGEMSARRIKEKLCE